MSALYTSTVTIISRQRAANVVSFPPKIATGRAETLEELRRKTPKAEIKQDRTKGKEH
jgi:hypothetical protein